MSSVHPTIRFLEAIYAWEKPETEWLAGIVAAMAQLWGDPAFTYAFTYDASDLSRFLFAPPVFDRPSTLLEQALPQALRRMPPDMVLRLYRRMDMGFGSPEQGIDSQSAVVLQMMGAKDLFAINGVDSSGKGCMVCLGAIRTELDEGERQLWKRLALHLSSAYRCRMQLAGGRALDTSDAVLSPDARLVSAGEAVSGERERRALVVAAHERQVARKEGNRATDLWRPRIDSRWTIVEATDDRGDPCLLARDNSAPAPGLDALTPRERQVVASAAMGSTTKEIAYDLGLSASTVRVLMSRALDRLNVKSRSELLALPSVQRLAGRSGTS